MGKLSSEAYLVSCCILCRTYLSGILTALLLACRYVMALSSDVEYLNSRDATIMGSRNGHAPIYLWYTLARKGYEGMRADVERCMRNAHVLKDMLVSAVSAGSDRCVKEAGVLKTSKFSSS